MSRFVVTFLVCVSVCLGQQSPGASGHDTTVCEKCNPCEDTLLKALKHDVPISLTDEDKTFIKIRDRQCNEYMPKHVTPREQDYQAKIAHQLYLYTPDHTVIMVDSTGIFWGAYQRPLKSYHTAHTSEYSTGRVFGTITIVGGVVVGVCGIISISNPSPGLAYTIDIALPITLIATGIGLLCK